MTITNGTTKIAGPFTVVVGSPPGGGRFGRGLWTGTVSVGGVATGDITVENFEIVVTAGSWDGWWGGSPTAPDLSVKTTKLTC